jgi:hypothetical protein
LDVAGSGSSKPLVCGATVTGSRAAIFTPKAQNETNNGEGSKAVTQDASVFFK